MSTPPDKHPAICAVILAAGQSSRMEDGHKLLLDLDGQPLISTVVEAALASKLTEVLLVTGHRFEEIAQAVADKNIRTIHNPHYREGLSTSLRIGIQSVAPDTDAALVLLGDMPQITPEMIDQLIDQYEPAANPAQIVAGAHGGRRGHPVLWDRAYFNALCEIEGDKGAKKVITTNIHALQLIELDNQSQMDVDTRQDYESLLASKSKN